MIWIVLQVFQRTFKSPVRCVLRAGCYNDGCHGGGAGAHGYLGLVGYWLRKHQVLYLLCQGTDPFPRYAVNTMLRCLYRCIS